MYIQIFDKNKQKGQYIWRMNFCGGFIVYLTSNFHSLFLYSYFYIILYYANLKIVANIR
jgi:hypothetical protein